MATLTVRLAAFTVQTVPNHTALSPKSSLAASKVDMRPLFEYAFLCTSPPYLYKATDLLELSYRLAQ